MKQVTGRSWSRAAEALITALTWMNVSAKSTASRLQIPIPSKLYRSEGYAHEEALFGIPKYGGSIAERLIHGGVDFQSKTAWTLCTSEDAANFDPGSSATPFILMIDRGECTFASKVRRAQHLGASGVIIADNTCLCSDVSAGACIKPDKVDCEQVEPIMADDGSGADIALPSFLMKKKDADEIKWNLENGENVQAEMTWSLPAPDDRVEWSLWTSAIDTSARLFKRDFKDVVTTIGSSAYFTPYYVIHDGSSYGCSGNTKCGNLCTNNGRYCLSDPDFDTSKGISGADAVKESLRQKCIWNLYGGDEALKEDQGIGEAWWSYVGEFFSRCYETKKFNDSHCVEGAMKVAGVDSRKVASCMEKSGGTEKDGENTILKKELEDKGTKAIVIVPTVFVNNVAERGGISTAAVLTTICAGFKSGTEPEVCRCAGQPSSGLVHACLNNSPTGVSSRGMSLGSTLFLLMAATGIMAMAGFVHYKRTQAHMRDQVRGILAEYMPLEDVDAPGSSARQPFMPVLGDTRSYSRSKEQQLV